MKKELIKLSLILDYLLDGDSSQYKFYSDQDNNITSEIVISEDVFKNGELTDVNRLYITLYNCSEKKITLHSVYDFNKTYLLTDEEHDEFKGKFDKMILVNDVRCNHLLNGMIEDLEYRRIK